MGVLMHECTGGNMRLYTICIDQRPVLVMSTDAEPPMEDTLTTDAKLMKAHRDMQALRAKMQARLPDAERLADQREIDEALDTWLGEDLHSFGLWNGDWDRLHIREARTEEARRWHTSLTRAIDAGEEEAGSEDWVLLLVPVTDSPDEEDED